MDAIIIYGLPVVCITAIAVLLTIYSWREFRYRKKIEFLTHLIDKGYESDMIDLNNL